jgi:hypothetical protein
MALIASPLFDYRTSAYIECWITNKTSAYIECWITNKTWLLIIYGIKDSLLALLSQIRNPQAIKAYHIL